MPKVVTRVAITVTDVTSVTRYSLLLFIWTKRGKSRESKEKAVVNNNKEYRVTLVTLVNLILKSVFGGLSGEAPR